MFPKGPKNLKTSIKSGVSLVAIKLWYASIARCIEGKLSAITTKPKQVYARILVVVTYHLVLPSFQSITKFKWFWSPFVMSVGVLVVRRARYRRPWTNFILNFRPVSQVFKMKFVTSCKSSNIVYLITCRRCGQQYEAGTEQPLHRRVNNHRYSIVHSRADESLVVEHFTGDRHTQVDMVVWVIDQLYSHDPCLRKIRESRWFRTLGTSYP